MGGPCVGMKSLVAAEGHCPRRPSLAADIGVCTVVQEGKEDGREHEPGWGRGAGTVRPACPLLQPRPPLPAPSCQRPGAPLHGRDRALLSPQRRAVAADHSSPCKHMRGPSWLPNQQGRPSKEPRGSSAPEHRPSATSSQRTARKADFPGDRAQPALGPHLLRDGGCVCRGPVHCPCPSLCGSLLGAGAAGDTWRSRND